MTPRRAGLSAFVAAATVVIVVVLVTRCSGDLHDAVAPEAIPPGSARQADTAISGDGTALAVWSEERHAQAVLMFSERPPHGHWSVPTPITKPQRWAVVSPKVVVNAAGDAVVTFDLRGRRERVLLGAFRSAGRDWEPAQAISPVTPSFVETSQDISAGGDLAIAYSSAFSESPGVFVTARDAGALGRRLPYRPSAPLRHPTAVGGHERW